MQMLDTFPSLERPKPGREYTILIAILGALWLVLSIVGCSKESQTGNVAETTATRSDTSPAANANGTAYNDTAHMTDGNILAELKESDSGEVALAKLAMTKAKSPAVKSYAQMLISDHSRLLKDDDQLATKMNMTPTPPANDTNPSHLTAMMSDFNSAPNGTVFDSLYMNYAVQDHKTDLADMQNLETQASSSQLKNAIRNAEPVLQKHLTRAEMVQKDLSKQSMAMQNHHR